MGMLRELLRALHGRLGLRYPRVLLAVEFQAMHVVALGGVGLLRLYQPMSDGRLLEIIGFSQLLIVFDNAFHLRVAFGLLRPADPWLHGERDPDSALRAWRAIAALPLDVLGGIREQVVSTAIAIVPISLFIVLDLHLHWYAVPVLFAGSTVVLVYGMIARYFGTELTLRPVLEEISGGLPTDQAPIVRVIPLRWKLLIALPAINVVTGVVVAGLSTGGHARLLDLGLDVLVALAVAFTVSLELTVLLARSILEPIQDLRAATHRVASGDLDTRVPVISNDETGALAGSFNEMMAGLQEREKLRDAFGTFVDPALAERILSEGVNLAGEEVEVTVLFIDIRDFTAFAERSSAREVVGVLNDFYERIVPVLVRHGGHANKFVGDGLLGVFGAPGRLRDHADRGVAAALEIAALVREHYLGELRIGIGVNSGPVAAGTIGGGGRLEFTVIGDPVNTASRVEEVTRVTDDDVLVTEATRCLLERDFGELEARGTVALKGKREQVALWAPGVGVAVDEGVQDERSAGRDGERAREPVRDQAGEVEPAPARRALK
jgi:adenylate cyclase